MKIFRDLSGIKEIKNPVVTTGSFDGVHVGHKVIINRLNTLARQTGGESVLITFYPHPRKVLYPETAGKDLLMINTQREKIELLKETGLDNLIIINFTLDFSQTSSIDFIRKILVGILHAKTVVVGFNHHFGHNREGDYDYLYQLGQYYHFNVEEIPEQDIQSESVSSTKIRKALLEGNIQRANAYLDHYYNLIGELKESMTICREIGFPTYNIASDEEYKLIPPEGVYAVTVKLKNNSFKGLLNIKKCVSENENEAKHCFMEILFIDEPVALDSKMVEVCFHKKIRELISFDDKDSLKKQLLSDKNLINELIY